MGSTISIIISIIAILFSIFTFIYNIRVAKFKISYDIYQSDEGLQSKSGIVHLAADESEEKVDNCRPNTEINFHICNIGNQIAVNPIMVFTLLEVDLSCVKAVYMIIDGNTGKQYIGSAYDNNESLWARWKSYATTYHGGNIDFIRLFEEKGSQYFEKFKYIILQIYPMTISNKEIIREESKYKNRFMTKEFGWNEN